MKESVQHSFIYFDFPSFKVTELPHLRFCSETKLAFHYVHNFNINPADDC